jgi:hypothetical protein
MPLNVSRYSAVPFVMKTPSGIVQAREKCRVLARDNRVGCQRRGDKLEE